MEEENENRPEDQEQDEDQAEQDAKEEKKEDEKKEKSKKSEKKKKPHRGPPTPTPEDLRELEQGFILDNIAVNSIAKDYSHTQPKLGPAIPPYNSQKDKHVKEYFKFIQVDGTLEKTEQHDGGCSIDGPVIDRFIESGAGYQYLSRRNAAGAGHSTDEVDGHAQFMQDAKPNFGWHGQFGYRRNSPWLRKDPSPFGVDSRSPTH
ncbi:sperm microtubule associated protein 1-like [Ptychodera flava]|uniref:sperm microtubule associated protein 1-like n=1 Tax=Ptychodera flava TaxID=63121 RepID=UPI00396A3FD1